MPKYWLMKCEFDECSFDVLGERPGGIGRWRGVRNYQARNYLRDEFKKGDLVFFYHSNCKEPGIAGLAEVIRAGYPDPSQFDPKHRYYDPRAAGDSPIWYSVDIKRKRKFRNFVHLRDLKAASQLKGMKVVQKGMRLSVQPVTAQEFKVVCKIGGTRAAREG